MNQPVADPILVFLRVPELGKVKTRLARRLGDRAALHLYRLFVLAELETLVTVTTSVKICFHPADGRARLESWLGPGFDYWPQAGRRLGERMAAAFTRAFQAGAERVVLMGTDIPDLPARIPREALRALRRYPAVIGPSIDGGYYLIGLARQGFIPALFGNLPWGTATVLSETYRIFEKNAVPVHCLPEWQDIDDYEDLLALARRYERGSGFGDTLARLLDSARKAILGAPLG
jgi:hypothetical protein